MKKIIILTVILLSFNLYSQVDEINSFEPVTVNRVKDMAVYPGCEPYRGDTKALVKCLGANLSQDVLGYLDPDYITYNSNKTKLYALIEFVISAEGYIENIKAKKGDVELIPEATRSVKDVAAYLKRSGIKIEPAKFADGNVVPLFFSIPITVKY